MEATGDQRYGPATEEEHGWIWRCRVLSFLVKATVVMVSYGFGLSLGCGYGYGTGYGCP